MEETNYETESRERSESVLTEVPANRSADNPPSPSSLPSATTKPLPPVTDRLRSLTDTAFKFVANASNETLGACAVGLCASTYLVLGRLGLVLIGAFGGVLLHATWDGGSSVGGEDGSDAAAAKKRQLGIEVAERALDWRGTKQSGTDNTSSRAGKVEASTLQKPLDFSEYPPATASALDGLTDAVIRDYVRWWYSPILPEEHSFPASCRQILVAFVQSFANHLSRKRAADPFLDFVANSTSILIVFLNELASALKASQKQEPEEALRTYLRYQPDSNLANVINADQQERKLRMVADDILSNFLDSKTFNCAPAKTFLQEVLATLILQPTITSCSKPEWINGWIVYLLEDGEPELMNVIDEGVEGLEGKMKQATSTKTPQDRSHQRRVSRAEEAMEEAMREAQRMNEMIAEEEARRKRGTVSRKSEDDLSTTTTDAGIVTPTSSDSAGKSVDNSMVFDSDGNALPLPVQHSPSSAFTNFDQIVPSPVPTALQPTMDPPQLSEPMLAMPLTLHNASITIMDIGESNDQIPLKQKPNDSMLVQIEPASSRFPGWMVTRQYAEYEPLHETLRRIAVISGVTEFANRYTTLPTWKGRSRASLIVDLEQYLKSALKSERLAESDSMKRFLEKEQGLEKVPSKNVLMQGGQALENVGKGFINVLGQGGKGVQTGFQTGGKVFQTGGKAILGGVTGVFGAVAGNTGKRPGLSRNDSAISQTSTGSSISQSKRFSQDLPRITSDTNITSQQSVRPPSNTYLSGGQSRSSTDVLKTSTTAQSSEESLDLPPPPDQMTDDFEPEKRTSRSSRPQSIRSIPSRPATPTRSLQPLSSAPSTATSPSRPPPNSTTKSRTQQPPRKQDTPLTEEETRILVDLMFATITDLLGLSSSAWAFRLSLLSAAKTYLLRPANPQLESIRALIQESVIDANLTSDEGMAAHIKKLRENSLPTEEELAKWPKEPSAEEKEKLRIKARKLLVERGMPSALTAVVGAGASGEALGRLFDCLQVEEVARGLIFALVLQAIRAATQ